jgi:hypothetical protein
LIMQTDYSSVVHSFCIKIESCIDYYSFNTREKLSPLLSSLFSLFFFHI